MMHEGSELFNHFSGQSKLKLVILKDPIYFWHLFIVYLCIVFSIVIFGLSIFYFYFYFYFFFLYLIFLVFNALVVFIDVGTSWGSHPLHEHS
jgi:hypothetical protein